MNATNKFCMGQIVTPDFSGPRRTLYKIVDCDFVQQSHEIKQDDLGVVVGHYDEGSSGIWIEILMSTGLTGYVPSFWIRPV